MVAWLKWLLKSDIGTILQHRPTAFALVLIPCLFVVIFVMTPFSLFIYICHILFPILIFLMYVLLKNPIKIFLASIPGLVLGSLFVAFTANFKRPAFNFDKYIEALPMFPFCFVFGAAPVVVILLIWYLWKTEDLWLKAIGIPLLLISLSPYIMIILGLLAQYWGY